MNSLFFQGFGIPEDKLGTTVPFVLDNTEYTLSHGAVVIAAITSCTNTSNPSVMLGAGKSQIAPPPTTTTFVCYLTLYYTILTFNNPE